MSPNVNFSALAISAVITGLTVVFQACDHPNRPTSLTLSVPQRTASQATESVEVQKSLSLYLAGDGQVFVLDRTSPTMPGAANRLTKHPFGPSLRELITKAKQATDKQFGMNRQGKSQFTCIIKTLPEASYDALINALDVMEACKIDRYAIVDSLSQPERALLTQK